MEHDKENGVSLQQASAGVEEHIGKTKWKRKRDMTWTTKWKVWKNIGSIVG